MRGYRKDFRKKIWSMFLCFCTKFLQSPSKYSQLEQINLSNLCYLFESFFESIFSGHCTRLRRFLFTSMTVELFSLRFLFSCGIKNHQEPHRVNKRDEGKTATIPCHGSGHWERSVGWSIVMVEKPITSDFHTCFFFQRLLLRNLLRTS